MIRSAITVLLGAALLAAAPTTTLNVTVNSASTTSFAPHAEQCVNAYTLANGNPFCVELVSDSGTNNGTIDDSNSSAWVAAQKSGTVNFSNLTAATDTEPGGANYGQDPNFPMFYNPNGAASIATTGEIEYTSLVCNNANYSCGHSWTGENLFLTAADRGQNPNTDHHVAAQGEPCDPNGKSQPANPPPYTIASGDRCELDFWLVRPTYPSVFPSPATNGSSFTYGGSGQCDMDALLGMYNSSGSSASNICIGTAINPADLVAAIQNNSWLPYALNTAVNCTTNSYDFPASYYDESNAGCPPEGARWHSSITDSQVNATSWSPAMKAIMRTAYHYGGFITDTTGGYGNGFNIQMIGGSGFTQNQSSDTDATDPIRWLADNGGIGGVVSVSNDNGGSENGISIALSNIAPYSVANNILFCKYEGTVNHAYSTSEAVPKTCGNV